MRLAGSLHMLGESASASVWKRSSSSPASRRVEPLDTDAEAGAVAVLGGAGEHAIDIGCRRRRARAPSGAARLIMVGSNRGGEVRPPCRLRLGDGFRVKTSSGIRRGGSLLGASSGGAENSRGASCARGPDLRHAKSRIFHAAGVP